MRAIYRICATMVLAATAAACNGTPTDAGVEPAARRDNGWGFGGGHLTDADSTAAVPNINGQNTTTLTDECATAEQRGGWVFGGGHATEPTTCQ